MVLVSLLSFKMKSQTRLQSNNTVQHYHFKIDFQISLFIQWGILTCDGRLGALWHVFSSKNRHQGWLPIHGQEI